MAGEWNKAPFEQLLIEPVRNGIYKTKDFHGRGAKIINMGELFAHPRLHAVPMKRVELNESERHRFLLSEGDLIFARRSLTAEGAGKCSVVLELDEATTFESSIIRARPDTEKANPLYLYYFFNSPSGFHALDTIRRQVAVAGITGGDLAKLEIPTPPLPEQHAIAHILGTLDDKIELNRRRNQTLEAMARALFKDWFVDFGPVRAKMESREPYLPAHLWQLFPDRFDDEGKPEGWEMPPLDVLAALVTTSVAPGKFPETVFAHYSIPAFDAGRMPAMALGQSIKSNKYIVDGDAVLVSKLNPQTPRVWLPVVATECAICSTEFMQFVPRDRRNRPYLYCLMSSQAMQQEVLKHVTGSTGSRQRAQPTQIVKVNILLPKSGVLAAFNKQAAPILNAIADNQRESQTLAQLRDTLLSKLISGELRIKDADKFMERVT